MKRVNKEASRVLMAKLISKFTPHIFFYHSVYLINDEGVRSQTRFVLFRGAKSNVIKETKKKPGLLVQLVELLVM